MLKLLKKKQSIQLIIKEIHYKHKVTHCIIKKSTTLLNKRINKNQPDLYSHIIKKYCTCFLMIWMGERGRGDRRIFWYSSDEGSGGKE